jgi:hypothetical protein
MTTLSEMKARLTPERQAEVEQQFAKIQATLLGVDCTPTEDRILAYLSDNPPRFPPLPIGPLLPLAPNTHAGVVGERNGSGGAC